MVILNEVGLEGRFNRAYRAAANLNEYLPLAIAHIFLLSPVFPFPTFIFSAIFIVARFGYPVMYTNSLEGRGACFGVSLLIASISITFRLVLSSSLVFRLVIMSAWPELKAS